MRTSLLAAGALIAFATGAIAQTPTTVPVANPNQRFITLDDTAKLSTNVVGLDVYNGKDDIGTIKDVAYDASGVRAYVISVGGFLGMGQHYVAVIPSQVMINYDLSDKKWHANMAATTDELKAAPEFKYDGKWSAGKA